MWVSSPNMDFVPDVPTHHLTEEFGLYTDGMYGPFEHLKWPQVWDALEPHVIAAPANPELRAGSKVLGEASVPWDLWRDEGAAWFHFTSNDWERDPWSIEDLGRLSYSVLERLRGATNEATHRALKCAEVTLAASDVKARHYLTDQIDCLLRAVANTARPQRLGESLQWFREAQRYILAVRAWYIYMTVVKPALDQKLERRLAPFPAGVPVWWVRRLDTITRRTQVGFVRHPVPWTDFFAKSKRRMFGKTQVIAPSWIDSVTLDTASIGFVDRLKKFSITSKPFIRLPRPVLAADHEPEPDVDEPEMRSQPDPPIQTRAEPGPSTEPVAPARRAKKRAKTGVGAQSAPTVPRMPPRRAEWLPPTFGLWAEVENALAGLDDDNKNRIVLFGLPPLHAFSGEKMADKIQNWLRIRDSCFSATADSGIVADARILLSTVGWRFALDGQYHNYDLPPGARVQPESAPDKIKRLPPYAKPASVLGKRREATQETSQKKQATTRTDGARAKRLVMRIDVAVHFGIDMGFPPYRSDPDPMPKWRNQKVDRSRAGQDRTLWSEITWELSVMHFRLDLLWLDVEVMRTVLDPEHVESELGRRQSSWLKVWSHVSTTEPGTDPAWFDWLLSPKWTDRNTGVSRLSGLVRTWPDFPDVPPFSPAVSCAPSALETYERELYTAICRYFFARKGRMPTLPLSRPPSIPQREEPENGVYF
ncbi:hypothetical protein FA95DRAFT_689567 [Auriscalpium vulgare]|uniref:Uncharacterized protein n=1 Tax=Auriscalpium vulgare TaxID=40419 RepID=A0ACB8S0Q1_9AGAM|nr:hypothetical protein FA95DRAFT_689567 [Auriscalpium vulgare]